MKNNKIFSFLLVASLAFTLTNCTETEEFIGYPLQLDNEFIELTGSIAAATSATAEGRDMNITVTLPQSFASDADVEVTATLKTGARNTATVTVPTGSTSGSGTITIPSDGVDSGVEGTPGFATLELAAILLDELEPGVNYTITGAPVAIDLYDAIQWPYDEGVVNGRMTYLVDWANPSINDLDAYVLGFEAAETGSRYETDIFDDTHPDGTYTIDVYTWDISETDIPWRVFFVYPDQETFEIFSGTLTGVGNGELISLVTFTKTTDPVTGVVTYSDVAAL